MYNHRPGSPFFFFVLSVSVAGPPEPRLNRGLLNPEESLSPVSWETLSLVSFHGKGGKIAARRFGSGWSGLTDGGDDCLLETFFRWSGCNA